MLPTKQGQVAEIKFCYEAIKRGFEVLRPIDHGSRYDAVVRIDNSKFLKVQIKSTSKDLDKKPGRYQFQTSHGADNKKSYQKENVDVFCFYIISLDIMYFIPIEYLPKTKKISVNPTSNKCKYIGFKENWQILQKAN